MNRSKQTAFLPWKPLRKSEQLLAQGSSQGLMKKTRVTRVIVLLYVVRG